MRTALPALLLFALGCGQPTSVHLESDGVAVDVELDPFALRILNGAGREVLRTFAGDQGAYGAFAAAIDDPETFSQLIPGWDGFVPREGPWRRAASARATHVSATAATLVMEKDKTTLTLVVHLERGRVRIEGSATPMVAPDPAGKHTKTTLAFTLPASEHFFGLGERYATSDHRGWSLYSWAEEAGVGQGEGAPPAAENPTPNGPSMTYFPVPFMLSSAGYGLYLDTTYRSEMHLGSERDDAWRLAVDSDRLALSVYVDDDPYAILEAYTGDSGRPPIPAPWVFGPRRRVSPSATVAGVPEWQLLRAHLVPTTGIDDAVHFLPASSQTGREDALRSWVETLHANGFKVMAYNNPYVSKSDANGAADYAYGVDHHLFATDSYGSPGETWFISGRLQTLSQIDLTDAAGVAWFQRLLTRSLDFGYDGWMHDFGEYTERAWRFADGRRGDAVHNVYPVLSAKAAFDLLEAVRPNDYLFFVRSGYAGTQAVVPAVWGGDAEASFDETQGLPAALRGGLNLALSGVPYWGSDISGYKCYDDAPRDKEIYLRWAAVGALSPIMQDQNACAYLLGDRDKWTLWSDAETTAIYAALARLHTRLQPYFMVLAEEAHARGTPLMRHPLLSFPAEPAAWETDGAFFLGPSLFAAPVVRRKETARHVWLPPGRYVDLDDGRLFVGGGAVDIDAPLAKVPLLILEDHLLPLLDPAVETLAPSTAATVESVVTADRVADRLDVIAALGPAGEATLTLADGTTLVAERTTTDGGNPQGLTAADPADIPTCALCYVESTRGDVTRIQVNSDLQPASTVVFRDLRLSFASGPARRIRWDVLRLP
ncbi:MAG: glycoside hydrolase family 31 protein [Deltaproteobacteria bacterium]|nr:glycoside hydrolase family 31 protein [Deltaproteobacteria bacterium]